MKICQGAKVAVVLRATKARPKNHLIAVMRIVSNGGQCHDRTYDPNSQKLDATKSRVHLWDRDGYKVPTEKPSNRCDFERK